MPDDAGLAQTVSAVRASLSHLLLRRFRSRIYERLQHGIEVPVRDGTYPILTTLASGESRSTDVAERAGIDRTTASRQIATLVAGGLVQQRSDDDDRRNSLLALTPRGVVTAGRIADNADELLMRALADWEPSDREALARLLPRLIKALD
jgi:DNA-binding MarR family transcriptional regulator